MDRSREEERPDDGFAGVFASYGPKLRRFLSGCLGNDADAQDLAHEAYLRLTRVKRPDLIRSPEAYLFRIASNLANEFLLKQRREPACVRLDDLQGSDGDSDGAAFAGALEHRADIARLERLLADLPPRYAAVLVLRKRDGYSHAEIARRLDIAPSTVPTYLKRALAHLRARWTQ